jgi:hypothetical protein
MADHAKRETAAWRNYPGRHTPDAARSPQIRIVKVPMPSGFDPDTLELPPVTDALDAQIAVATLIRMTARRRIAAVRHLKDDLDMTRGSIRQAAVMIARLEAEQQFDSAATS